MSYLIVGFHTKTRPFLILPLVASNWAFRALVVLLNKDEGIGKVYNIRQDIRYLIHEDQPQKFQYSKNEIVTNRKAYLWTCLEDEQEYQTFTIKDCEKAVMVEHLDLIDLMKRYGLEQYKKNRVVMIDIINAFLRDEIK